MSYLNSTKECHTYIQAVYAKKIDYNTGEYLKRPDRVYK